MLENTHIIKKNLLIKSVILFFFVYDIAFQGSPTLLSTRKLMLLVVLIFLISTKGVKINIINNNSVHSVFIIFFYFILLLYAFLITKSTIILSDKYIVYPYIFYFILYTLISPYWFQNIFVNLKEFCYCLIIVSLVQASIVWLQYLSLKMRLFLDSIIYSTSNISFLETSRATGLGASGSQLSLYLCFGIFAIGLLQLKEKSKNDFFFSLSNIFLFSAILITGRTGLLVGVTLFVALQIFLFIKNKSLKQIIFIFIAFFIILNVLNNSIEMFNIGAERLEYTYNRGLSVFQNGTNDAFFSAISSMRIPKISYHTLIGTGIIRGDTAYGLCLQHDSGYIMRYFALGLPLAILSYLILGAYEIKLLSKIKKNKYLTIYILLFIALLFFIEIKEPYIFYCMPCFIAILSILIEIKN